MIFRNQIILFYLIIFNLIIVESVKFESAPKIDKRLFGLLKGNFFNYEEYEPNRVSFYQGVNPHHSFFLKKNHHHHHGKLKKSIRLYDHHHRHFHHHSHYHRHRHRGYYNYIDLNLNRPENIQDIIGGNFNDMRNMGLDNKIHSKIIKNKKESLNYENNSDDNQEKS